MAACADHAVSVQVPLSVVQELLADRCCAVHLRVQLSRAVEGRLAAGLSHTGLGSLDGRVAMQVAEHLDLTDALSARAVGTGLLAAVCATHSTASNGGTHADAELVLAECKPRAHDRVRVRLWLHRAGELAKQQPDETIFESRVASYVDSGIRLRLEGELAEARRMMADEVREAKASMMQCMQAISDLVDRRVQEKVSALAEEFDRRADEQAKGICEMVEQRFREKSQALQVEVERRTDEAIQAVERRAVQQEILGARLQEEVTAVRAQLQAKVLEQELGAARLAQELEHLRRRFVELVRSRDAPEPRAGEVAPMRPLVEPWPGAVLPPTQAGEVAPPRPSPEAAVAWTSRRASAEEVCSEACVARHQERLWPGLGERESGLGLESASGPRQPVVAASTDL